MSLLRSTKPQIDSQVESTPVVEPTGVSEAPARQEPLPLIPIIKIQRASKSTDHSDASLGGAATPPAIETVLANDRQRISEQAANQGSDLVAVLPRSTNTLSEVAVVPVRIKKRKTALRKTRNVLVRKTFLKASLGRQLAVPTKEALRRQAKGEDVTIADITLLS